MNCQRQVEVGSGMSKELENVLLYCKYFLEEYKSVLETTYKDVLDDAKKSDEVNKIFKLYSINEIVPYCFMYDFGTWIFFVTLSNPKCIVRYNDPKFNRDWCEICLYEDREKQIFEELNICKDDILESFVFEGCRFLHKSEIQDDIKEQAHGDARLHLQMEISKYRNKDVPLDVPVSKKDIELPSKITLRWLVEHVPYQFWLWLICALATAFVVGVESTRVSFIREIFQIKPETTNQLTTVNNTQIEKTNIFAYVSKDGTILQSNNFPWKISKSKDEEDNVVYTINERYGDATTVSIYPDNHTNEYQVYNVIGGVAVKFTCAEEKISNFTIKIKQ